MTGLLTLRADADASMGTGHLMRMLALGQAWQDADGSVRLLGRVEPAALRDRITAEGFEFVALDRRHPDTADLDALLALTRPGQWVALDGYHFDASYMRALRAAGRKSLVLDDICDRDAFDADIYLNQNLGAERLRPALNPEATLLRGPRFALIRREFLAAAPADRPHPERARNLLVTFGGADPGNVTAQVLLALVRLSGLGLHARVVVGAANPHAGALRDLAAAMPFPCEMLQAVADMPGLMAWADLAVSAAGSTCWELCLFGAPMLLTSIADNQAGVLAGLVEAGAAQAFPLHAQPGELAAVLGQLLENPGALRRMREAGQALVDGRGARRVVDAMRGEITLRPARPGDAETLLGWRNHPSIAAQSFSPGPVPREQHEAWFADKLADPDCLFLMAEDVSGVPAGHIRFDIQGDAAVLSISVAPGRQGQGIGSAMTRKACILLLKARPEVTVQALVKPENAPSAAMFRSAGFSQGAARQDFAHPHLLFEFKGVPHVR